ncbi:MAG: aldose epimerase family protein [Eubacteriales bacterium]|nr:aldose epimerase family protein [Eubacteriales bacterium]
MRITSDFFGTTSGRQAITKFTLTDGAYSVSVLTFGGIIQSLIVPDRDGNPVDVVLGFDDVRSYEGQSCYIGALLGRCANRIAGSDVIIGNYAVHLACNDNGICHLHGGKIGFDRRIWTPAITDRGLELSYCSPDGEEGYPGTMHATVTYRLENGKLSLIYHAVCDSDTLCNLSNHTYFNLSGHASGTIGEQYIQILADAYTPLAWNNAPDGHIAPVAGTPLDLRDMHRFMEGWDMPFDQITLARGYDHNYLCNGTGLRTAAYAYSKQTGIRMEVQTDMPGLQLYSGNYLKNLPIGKQGAQYGIRNGFCIETQYPPNAVNCPTFPQPILRAGEEYVHTTVYMF